MIETSSLHEVVSIIIRPNKFKMADGRGEEASAPKKQNWGYYEANVLLKYGPMKKYNGNYRRWVATRISGRTLPQNLMTKASTMKQHKLYNHA